MVTYVLQDQQLTPSKSESLEGLKIGKGNSILMEQVLLLIRKSKGGEEQMPPLPPWFHRLWKNNLPPPPFTLKRTFTQRTKPTKSKSSREGAKVNSHIFYPLCTK